MFAENQKSDACALNDFLHRVTSSLLLGEELQFDDALLLGQLAGTLRQYHYNQIIKKHYSTKS